MRVNVKRARDIKTRAREAKFFFDFSRNGAERVLAAIGGSAEKRSKQPKAKPQVSPAVRFWYRGADLGFCFYRICKDSSAEKGRGTLSRKGTLIYAPGVDRVPCRGIGEIAGLRLGGERRGVELVIDVVLLAVFLGGKHGAAMLVDFANDS